MKIQIYPDAKGEFRWRCVAENGRITADGAEGYDSYSNAMRAVKQHIDDMAAAPPIERCY